MRHSTALLALAAWLGAPAAGFDTHWHAEFAPKNLMAKELDALQQYPANNPQVRGAAVFLHFDNLNGDLQTTRIDYLLSHLLERTRTLIAGYNQLHIGRSRPRDSYVGHPGRIPPRRAGFLQPLRLGPQWLRIRPI